LEVWVKWVDLWGTKIRGGNQKRGRVRRDAFTEVVKKFKESSKKQLMEKREEGKTT